MCLTQTVVVLGHADGVTRVLLDGREQSLQNLLVPDVVPGDRVVVGVGLVLGRPADGTAPRDDVDLPISTSISKGSAS